MHIDQRKLRLRGTDRPACRLALDYLYTNIEGSRDLDSRIRNSRDAACKEAGLVRWVIRAWSAACWRNHNRLLFVRPRQFWLPDRGTAILTCLVLHDKAALADFRASSGFLWAVNWNMRSRAECTGSRHYNRYSPCHYHLWSGWPNCRRDLEGTKYTRIFLNLFAKAFDRTLGPHSNASNRLSG